MGFRKIRTIQVSERVFNLVCEELDLEQTENYVKIDGWLECFSDCREQGYVLHLDSLDFDSPKRTKENLYIWACECKNSDNIIVMWQTEYPNNEKVSEETYKERRKYFSYNAEHEAKDFIIKLVKEHFRHEFYGD